MARGAATAAFVRVLVAVHQLMTPATVQTSSRGWPLQKLRLSNAEAPRMTRSLRSAAVMFWAILHEPIEVCRIRRSSEQKRVEPVRRGVVLADFEASGG